MPSPLDSARNRWVTFLLIGLLAVVVFGTVGASWQAARAQDVGAAGGDEAARADPGVKKNLFIHIIKSAGIVFGPMILLISIALVALIVLLAMDLRMNVNIPPAFV